MTRDILVHGYGQDRYWVDDYKSRLHCVLSYHLLLILVAFTTHYNKNDENDTIKKAMMIGRDQP